MDELVSIIIPTYKGNETVLLAVLSSLNQTYKNTEIIVVDDNGVGTVEQIMTEKILKPYILKGKINYITHSQNINGSAARNTGIIHSNGEYLAFLDDDDFIYPQKIEKQVELLNKLSNDYGLVICGGYYVKENGSGYIKVPKLPRKKEEILVNYMTEKIYFNTSTILIKKTVVKDLNGFDESFRRHQDWEFCSRVIEKYNVDSISEPLIIKYTLGRNSPSSPELTAQYNDHYLNKMKPILLKMTSKSCGKVLNYNFRRVAFTYFLNRQFLAGLKYLKDKTKNPLLQLFIVILQTISHVQKKIFSGSKKRVLPKNEMLINLIQTKKDE